MSRLLTDICSPKQWKTIPASQLKEEGYPVFGANGIIGYFSEYNHESPTILITCRGATCGEINVCSPQSYVTGNAMSLDNLSDEFDLGFLEHYLRTYDFSKVISGSAQPQITKQDLKKVIIPDLSREEQILLSQQFDAVIEKQEACQAVSRRLDELVKSRFVEMFGDIDNTLFDVVSIQEVCEPIKDGTHQTPTYATGPEDGVPFLSSKDVTSGKICWENIRYITPELHEHLHKRVAPRMGDVLLAKNGTTGICAVVDRDVVFDLYVTLALLRPLRDIESIYLWAAVNSDRTKEQFDSRLKGIGVPNLHLKEIKETQIVKPPLALQQEFAAFVQKVDKLKFIAQQQIDKLQMIYDSLAQEYFSAE